MMIISVAAKKNCLCMGSISLQSSEICHSYGLRIPWFDLSQSIIDLCLAGSTFVGSSVRPDSQLRISTSIITRRMLTNSNKSVQTTHTNTKFCTRLRYSIKPKIDTYSFKASGAGLLSQWSLINKSIGLELSIISRPYTQKRIAIKQLIMHNNMRPSLFPTWNDLIFSFSWVSTATSLLDCLLLMISDFFWLQLKVSQSALDALKDASQPAFCDTFNRRIKKTRDQDAAQMRRMRPISQTTLAQIFVLALFFVISVSSDLMVLLNSIIIKSI